MNAPSERREDLLKELEHFAFRGIPNLNSPRPVGDGGGGGEKDAPDAKKGDEDTKQQHRRWSTSSSEHENKV